MLLKSAALAAVVSSSFAQAADLEGEFATWIATYRKTYGTAAVRAERFAVWQTNREIVTAHNVREQKGLTTFRLAMNQLGDLSNTEYRAMMLGGIDTRRHATVALSSPVAPSSAGNAPDSVDWRERGFVGKVKDQGQVRSLCACMCACM